MLRRLSHARGRAPFGGPVFAMVFGVAMASCGGGDESATQIGPGTDAGQDGAMGDAAEDVVGDAFGEGDQDASKIGYPIDGIETTWFPCSLEEGEDDGLAECAATEMPLFWDAPDGRTMTIYAKRLLAPKPSKRQIWLLAGGPGASGVMTQSGLMKLIRSSDEEVDIYALDHRGTGYSGRLGCPEQEDPASLSGTSITSLEMPACLEALQTEWGDALDAVTSTYSSVDLAAYIEATREAGKQVLVLGGSYGSYWAHRYLQVAPSQADGVVIAGIAPPDSTFIRFDERANQTGEDVMDACGADAFCASKLGPDPWGRLGEVLTSMESGHCSSLGASRYDMSVLFAYTLYYHPANAVVPAVVYRLERCNAQDRAAIASLFDFEFGSGGVWDMATYSILLQQHITVSEMWDHPDFEGVDLAAYFQQIRETAYVAKNSGAQRLSIVEMWTPYHDPLDDGWADTATPMLMMQGRLDPATSWYDAVAMRDHFDGPKQHWVEFAQAPHSVLRGTPLSSDAEAEHCAMRLFLAFLKDPSGELDTSCVNEVLPMDFRGTQTLSQALLGTDDFWEE